LSTKKNVDTIVVVKDGQFLGKGTYELMTVESIGVYANLINLNSSIGGEASCSYIDEQLVLKY
jgi:hypothetical protein